MVKAFSTNKTSESAGHHLNRMFSEWVEEMTDNGDRIEILDVSSSGSKLGWMMIIQYKLIEENTSNEKNLKKKR